MELSAGLLIDLESMTAAGMTIAQLWRQPAQKHGRTKLLRLELERRPGNDRRTLFSIIVFFFQSSKLYGTVYCGSSRSQELLGFHHLLLLRTFDRVPAGAFLFNLV
jgi:hypothetical protein